MNNVNDTEIYQQIINLLQVLQLRASQISTTDEQNKSVAMLTIKQAVKKYSISEYTLRKLISQNKIIYIRTGMGENGKILIYAASLDAYLNGTAN